MGFTLVRALGAGDDGLLLPACPFFIDIPVASLAVKLAVFSMITCGLWRTLPHLPPLVLLSPLDGGGGALPSVGTSTLRSGLELLIDYYFTRNGCNAIAAASVEEFRIK